MHCLHHSYIQRSSTRLSTDVHHCKTITIKETMKHMLFIFAALLFTSWAYSHEDHKQEPTKEINVEAQIPNLSAQISTLGVFIIAGTISCLCLSYFFWKCWRMRNVDDVVFDNLVPDAEIRIHEQLPPPILFRMHTQPPHPLGAAENV